MATSMTRTQAIAGIAALATAAGLGTARPARAATQLTGAGSTFDYPFFSKAFYQYSQDHPDVTVNYQGIGSGGGIAQFTAKTVDFGATDVPMNPTEVAKAQAAGGPVIQIPVALGGVAISYNLPGVIGGGLRLSPEVLAAMFLGKITSWDDPAIKKVNPSADLPSIPVVVVHRSDGSGTTYIFTDYMSHISPDWKSAVGTGKSVQWPAQSSIGGKGNEGVAGAIRQTPGAIGYVELAYVVENQMTQAMLQNASGDFLFCTTSHVAAAAASKPEVTATNFSIVDSIGKGAWPISGYSWAIVYAQPADTGRGKILHDVLDWVVTKGQDIAATLDYVPLPSNVAGVASKGLSEMKV
jgi:phosphate transport system substrate-binding protein